MLFVLLLSFPRPGPRIPRAEHQNVRLDPPQVVQTRDHRMCVHTRLTDEVEESKIQQTLRLVREMGATTIVEFLPWSYVEQEEGEYHWLQPDRIIKHAENQGLTVIARLGFVPEWARDDVDGPTSLNHLPEDQYPAFARYVAAFAERYAGRVSHIIIWNEPNLNFEWGGRPADPQSYTRLLKLAYEAAHEANPDVVILNGALAPTVAPPGGQEGGWNDLDYLREMYEAGAGAYFDAVAVHTYGFGLPPQVEPAPDALNFRRIELMRDIMVKYGDEDKPVYLTETGWNDHPRWAYGVSAAQRIAYTLEMYEFTQEVYPWLKALCVWAFRYPAPTNSYPDYYTLVSPNFHLKPIYEALQEYAH
jgi:hypothetical protein